MAVLGGEIHLPQSVVTIGITVKVIKNCIQRIHLKIIPTRPIYIK